MEVQKIEVTAPAIRVRYTLKRRSLIKRLIYIPKLTKQHYHVLRLTSNRRTSFWWAIRFALVVLK
jgi:hypothetical protein